MDGRLATTEASSEQESMEVKAEAEAWPGIPLKRKHKHKYEHKSCGGMEVMRMGTCDSGVVLNECCKSESLANGVGVDASGVDWFDVLKKILTEVDWETLLKFIRETAAVFQEGDKGTEPSASNHDMYLNRAESLGLGLMDMIRLYRTITKYVSPEDLAKLVEVVKGLLGALQSSAKFAKDVEAFRANNTNLPPVMDELGYTKLASDIEALGINFDLGTLITLLTTLLEVLQYFKGK